MTFVVPLVLGGLAIAVMALVSLATSRRRRTEGRSAAAQVRILVHSINDDRCTGCDACVAVCPTNVLDLVENKSRVLRFEDCIQCEACMWACPTTALVMHPEGTEPPPHRLPHVDDYYQTAVPGQYLIGEVAGKPLVKNAANLGRAVVEHMVATGLRPASRGARGVFDVAIVGSGPGGLSAALTCIARGLSYVLLEKDNLVASTIARYPKGKLVMAEPYDCENLSHLPVFDSTKEEILPIWRELIDRVGVKIRMNEAVERVVFGHDGWFEIRSNVAAYHAQRVVLATGLRGKPRTLGVPGENLPKVQSLLEDPDLHRGQTVCVVGGGDSALEAAVALADAGAKVVLSYRGRSFSRAQPKIRQTVESYRAQRRIKVKYQSEVAEFSADAVTLQMADGSQKRYPNQAAFVLIGADPPIEWLSTLGIHFIERPHMESQPASDQLIAELAGAAAAPCPETAAGAAAAVLGHGVADELRARPSVARSRGRRFVESASALFTGTGAVGARSSKLERPMPLLEFAKNARKHSGRGRRDKLDPRERTRVLRMLRDEGGRQADEDSKIYVLERLPRDRAADAGGAGAPPRPSARGSQHPRVDRARPAGSPPPGPALLGSTRHSTPRPPEPSAQLGRPMPHLVPTVLEEVPEDPVRTLPPSSELGETARPAVIIGLARAAAGASRAGGGRRRREPPPPPPPAVRPPVFENATRQLAAEDARRLVERAQRERARDPGPAFEELPGDFAAPVPPARPGGRRAPDGEEPTRQVRFSEGDIYPMAPPPAGATRGQEDPTRQVELNRYEALSEVDWDLDS